MAQKSLLSKKYLLRIIVITLILGCGWLGSELLVRSIMKVEKIEPKHLVNAINRYQRYYYMQNNKFESNLSVVLSELGINSHYDKYRHTHPDQYIYGVKAIDANQAIAIATPKITGLKSYIGIVFVSKTAELKTIGIVCESNQPSTIPPESPKLVGGKIICGLDSTEVAKSLYYNENQPD